MTDQLIHIVDDDAQVRDSTSFLLQSHGFATESYADGPAFLAGSALGEGCVLLDIRMPHMSGLEVQERLSERNVDLPVIILSGHGDMRTAVQAMRLGAIDFLEKPYAESDLISAISRAAEWRRDRTANRYAAEAGVARLSPREKDVLRGLLAGLSSQGIAHALGLSVRTVEMHRVHMLAELEARSLAEAIRIALDAGLEPLE